MALDWVQGETNVFAENGATFVMKRGKTYEVIFLAGISVAVYTGLLLSDMKAVSLWATPVLPLLFAVSSLSCGCAVVVGTACFSGTLSVFGSVLRQVANADAALLVLVSSIGVLIGGFVLRYGIVLAGVHPSVYAVVL